MDQPSKRMMEEIEISSSISLNQFYDVANAVQHGDLSDEMTVRLFVHRLANLSDSPISQQKKDEIIHSIIHNEMLGSMDTLDCFFDSNK